MINHVGYIGLYRASYWSIGVVQGSLGFKARGFRILGIKIECSGFRVYGLGLQCFGIKVSASWIEGLGLRAWGSKLWASG